MVGREASPAPRPTGRLATSSFRPAWWLPGPHLQTIWPVLAGARLETRLRRERLELPDGDFLDLDWASAGPGSLDPGVRDSRAGAVPPADQGLVILLHGLEGSSHSHYLVHLINRLGRLGMEGVVVHFRGCSGEPNRLARSYHAGDTADLAYVVAQLRARFPGRTLAAVGYSLGGNVLLKWLGETGPENPLQCAAAISVPFRLARAADRLERGASRIYQRHLLARLKAGARLKLDRTDFPYSAAQIDRLRSLREFDALITAPLHGFQGVEDYYRRASSAGYLHAIAVPALIVHARDDPFIDPGAIPTVDTLSPTTTLELSATGGHVGFVSGTGPLRPRYWLSGRLLAWLRRCGVAP